MVCLGNMCVDTLHKGDNGDDDNDNDNNNNNNNKFCCATFQNVRDVFNNTFKFGNPASENN